MNFITGVGVRLVRTIIVEYGVFVPCGKTSPQMRAEHDMISTDNIAHCTVAFGHKHSSCVGYTCSTREY